MYLERNINEAWLEFYDGTLSRSRRYATIVAELIMRIRLTCAVLLVLLLPAGFVEAGYDARPGRRRIGGPQERRLRHVRRVGIAHGCVRASGVQRARAVVHRWIGVALADGLRGRRNQGRRRQRDPGWREHAVFVDAGFTVFVINHRQAPLFRYPAAVEDARRAVRYIRHHGQDYSVTNDAIAAFGFSSGAHLVLMLAMGDGDGDPDSPDAVEHLSSKVDVVASFAGPTDLTAEDWRGTVGSVRDVVCRRAARRVLSGGAHAEASPSPMSMATIPPCCSFMATPTVVPVSQARASPKSS